MGSSFCSAVGDFPSVVVGVTGCAGGGTAASGSRAAAAAFWGGAACGTVGTSLFTSTASEGALAGTLSFEGESGWDRCKAGGSAAEDLLAVGAGAGCGSPSDGCPSSFRFKAWVRLLASASAF